MSINRGLDKEDVVWPYHGILLSDKNEWNNVVCNYRDGPRDFHTKWSKSERERQISYDNYLYVESKKIVKKELIYEASNSPTDIENKHGYPRERGIRDK